MKITVNSEHDDRPHEYEGDDLYPLVDEKSERLDIRDNAGRTLAIYPRGKWHRVQVEHDDEDAEKAPDQAEPHDDAPSVGTAYIDIKPRVIFPEDEIISLLEEISDRLDGRDISVTKR